MDGYAVRAADVRGASMDAPIELRVASTIAAGGGAGATLPPGEAIRIMTGAPVPAGADTVVRVEDTDGGTTQVRIHADRDLLRNIRPRGEDVQAGDVVATRGTQLRAAHLGLIASVGHATVQVHRPVRVAILSSGDELVDVDRFDEVLAGRRIISSNSYTIEGCVRAAGAIAMSLGTVPDDPAIMRERLRDLDADMLITTGGVSVGAFDHTRAVLQDLGATIEFWRARIRPGAPIGFGSYLGRPWIGLPGNPVSALVTFELFVRPALRRMQGHATPYRRPVAVRLAQPVTTAAPLTHFLRAVIRRATDGAWEARLTGPQGSGLLSSMARANALLIVPEDRQRLDVGETASALPLHDDPEYADTMIV